MGNQGRTTVTKRQKERARQERQQKKAEKRTSRQGEPKKERLPGDEDPDIAGIIPGPQPIQGADEPSKI